MGEVSTVAFLASRNILTKTFNPGLYLPSKEKAILPPRRYDEAGRRVLSMQDYSSSAYWNKLYTEEPPARMTEWHVDGATFVVQLERVLGPPSETAAILNVGCGTSDLWSR